MSKDENIKYANWKLLPATFQTLVMDPKVKTWLFGKLNDACMQYDPHRNINTYEKINQGLNSYMVEVRQDIHCLDRLIIQLRQKRLRKQLIQDYIDEEEEMREVDLAHVPTFP